MRCQIKTFRAAGPAILANTCLVLTLLSLLSCSSQREVSEGVQLILNTPGLEPTTTFELRFDQAAADAAEIGNAATNAPLIITPPLAGSFVWLSRRSGLFTPSEPTVLGRTYHFRLRAGLRSPAAEGGGLLKARLHRVFRAPPLAITDVGTAWGLNSSNAPSEPEIKLQFNAEVKAPEAASFLEFRDTGGVRIPAQARQATREDYFYHSDYARETGSPLTWKEQFYAAAPQAAPRGRRPRRGSETNDQPVPNRLCVTPARPLPVAKGWKLVVARNIPSPETKTPLHAPFEVAIGDVTPFTLADAKAESFLREGKRLSLSFTKALSPEITATNWSRWISLSPTPTNLTALVQRSGLFLRGDFLLNTRYTVRIQAGLPAEEAFKLAERAERRLQFEPLPPRLYFPAFSASQPEGGNRRFEMLALNLPDVRVRAKQLDRHNLIHALRGYGSYYRHEAYEGGFSEPYREVDFNVVPGRTIFDRLVSTPSPVDQARRVSLSWDEILGRGEPGTVFLAAEQHRPESHPRARPGAEALVQVTDLGLIWKRSREEVTTFLFSHATGQPVSNAVVRLMSDDNEALFAGETDARGLVEIPILSKIRPGGKAEPEGRWLMAERGRDLRAVNLEENILPIYGFNLPLDWWSDQRPDRRVMLFTDRLVYRPGETAHLKALVRDWRGGRLLMPLGGKGTLRGYDSKEQKFFETNFVLTPFGSWAESIPLPTGTLGAYRVELHVGEVDYNHWFQVQEFQPNAFEISLKTKAAYAPGERVEIPLSARYYMGKALSHATVRWSFEASDAGFAPEGYGDFAFGSTLAQSGLGRETTSIALQGEGVLSNGTSFVIAPEMSFNPKAPQPRSGTLFVEITDLNQQTLSQQAGFTCFSSDFYLGIKRGKESVRAGEPAPIEIIAVRPDGIPQAEPIQARLTFQHVEWRTVRLQGAGRTRSYRTEPVITNILEQDVFTQPVQRADNKWELAPTTRPPPALVAPEAGLYVVEVRAKDSGGREVVTATTLTASGREEIAWNYRNEFQFELVPDQKSYTPGQTATVLVKAPMSGLALVTVEREKVLRSFVTPLRGNAPTIQVPIEASDAPNVFVSVTLLRGADESPKRFKSPELRLGYCQLKVEAPESRLEVSVKPDAAEYRPGDPVQLAVEVKDSAGQTVPGAEVTLFAVDEGILSLSEYATPDPHAFFFKTRPLSVRSGSSLPSLLPEDPEQLEFGNKGYLVGGGGRETRPRKNFLPCAFWNGTLLTGGDGRVEARFVAPDSLTRYRVVAVVQSTRNQFGSSQSSFQINKPLMIEPALPRFANMTDLITARAVIHNQTDRAGAVEVTLQLDDKARLTEAARPPAAPLEPRSPAGGTTNGAAGVSAPLLRGIRMIAHASAVVEFPLEFTEPGAAQWIWRARFAEAAAHSEFGATNSPLAQHDQFTDAVQSSLQVGYPVPLLREIYLNRTEAAETNLFAGVNPQLLEGKGTVTVSVSNTRLQELDEAVTRLLHYPYGCVEQTSSSLLPWLVLRNAPTAIPHLCRSPREVEAAVQAGLKRLFSMQTQSGGLSYWPGGTEPMLWGSAYGGMVLALASRQGFALPQASLNRLLDYLSQQLRQGTGVPESADVSDRCLALYTLALAGRGETAYHELMFSKRDTLPAESRATLALAILESKGPATMVDELLEPRNLTKAHAEGWFGCPARELALQLLAWTRHHPDAPAVDRLVAELMRARQNAHWGTTQGDAWALHALSEYAARVETRRMPAAGTIAFRGQNRAFQLGDKATTFETTIELAPGLASTPLLLSNAGRARLFTKVKFEIRPAAAPQSAVDRGYRVQRSYFSLDDEGRPRDPGQLRVGDSVLVSLRIEVREPAHYVAIDDPLPAVFEAINPEFKSRQSQRPAGLPPAVSDGLDSGNEWFSDFRELRTDRALFFRDHVAPGTYAIRYLARVRAAGTATAPAAKVEEMYHPDRFGLSDTQRITSLPLE